jgi:hypothetical protein
MFGLAFQFHLLSQKYPMMAHLTLDVVPSAVRMLKPGCAMRGRGHRQTQARHEEDKQGIPHS